MSDESGQQEVYVRPFPAGPGRWRISASRGQSSEPRWRGDGKEIFYVESESISSNRLMAVPVVTGSRGDFQAS
jgi:hypothetical protein